MMSALDEVRSALTLHEITDGAKQAILSGEATATEEGRQLVGQLLDAHRRRPGRPSGTVPSIAKQQGYARFLHRSQHMAFADIKDRVPGLSNEQIHAAIGKFANGRITKAAKNVATKLVAMKSE